MKITTKPVESRQPIAYRPPNDSKVVYIPVTDGYITFSEERGVAYTKSALVKGHEFWDRYTPIYEGELTIEL